MIFIKNKGNPDKVVARESGEEWGEV